jgi:hypothetical protein
LGLRGSAAYYETLVLPLMPELGATNTYELKRKK